MISFTRFALAPAVLSACLALSACGQRADPAAPESQAPTAEIEITNARIVLPAVSGNPAAGYFELTNNTAEPVVLTGVSLDQSSRTEMHETLGTSMAELQAVAIQPGAQTVFAPGGQHLMIFDPPSAATSGTTRTLTFLFESGRRETAVAVIETRGGDAVNGMDHSGVDH